MVWRNGTDCLFSPNHALPATGDSQRGRMNYYNEFDPYAAQWLRNLVVAGMIPHGDVDHRSILDVKPADLAGYTQCHFFCGIAGWPLALALAGWPETRPVWTGSCPCQPLSSAGKQKGHADERHLWPAFYELIAECGPATVFGEQVASKDGREWLCGVRADLEAVGYAVGAADLCAASVGAPHIRQRLFWMADATGIGFDDRNHGNKENQESAAHCRGQKKIMRGKPDVANGGAVGRMGDTEKPRLQVRDNSNRELFKGGFDKAGGANFWANAELIHSTDGKTRRIEPGVSPLAHGVPNRVGKLRAYGNAIVPQAAAEFITAIVPQVAAEFINAVMP